MTAKADRNGNVEALLKVETEDDDEEGACVFAILSAGVVSATHWCYERTELLFDTCAARSVCPPSFACHVAIQESRALPIYKADGTKVSHVG